MGKCSYKHYIIIYYFSPFSTIFWSAMTVQNFIILVNKMPKLTSNARTTQFAMMVSKTAYSNGAHSIMNRVHRRTFVSSVNTKREDGPGVSDFSSFFFFLLEDPISWRTGQDSHQWVGRGGGEGCLPTSTKPSAIPLKNWV